MGIFFQILVKNLNFIEKLQKLDIFSKKSENWTFSKRSPMLLKGNRISRGHASFVFPDRESPETVTVATLFYTIVRQDKNQKFYKNSDFFPKKSIFFQKKLFFLKKM